MTLALLLFVAWCLARVREDRRAAEREYEANYPEVPES